MEVIIQPDADHAADLVTRLVAKQLREKPHLVLGLATGRTMESVYARLARLHQTEKLDFSLCRTFNLDEYVGLPAGSPYSYRHYMDQHLFSHINIDRRNTYLPDGSAPDLGAACREYEERIREVGGIDLQLLGIGTSGHIGFNEPLSALSSRTREKALTRATLEQNGPLCGGDADTMPRRALTMGVGTILEAGRIVLLATGEHKAGILAKAIEGPITSMVSATALQLHRSCRIIVDEAAAQKLEGQAYYRWLFENEPEWAPYRA
jgi:glucosamine-6-phosphate deaminase